MKTTMVILSILLGLYIVLCLVLFLFQENIIFLPQKLSKEHQFRFAQPFEERYVKSSDRKLLHGLLFKSDNSKGLIFYLHGNAGSLDGWGEVADVYTALGYDIFLLDYRGYGKSEGELQNEQQLYEDVQAAYTEMLKAYDEQKIVVLGYSLGSAPAARLASLNRPRLMILQAPYFSMAEMMKSTFPIVPTFLLKYKLETFRYITECKMPVVMIHGDEDEVIPYGQSLKLKGLSKATDTLITIKGMGHNGMTHHHDYGRIIRNVLE
jgi:pimeloyl-ACP methyl ester carboxylesterase